MSDKIQTISFSSLSQDSALSQATNTSASPLATLCAQYNLLFTLNATLTFMTNAASSYLQQQNELQTKDLNFYSVYTQAASCGTSDGKTGGYDPTNPDIQAICRAYSSGHYDDGVPFPYPKDKQDPSGKLYTLGTAIAAELAHPHTTYSHNPTIATDSAIINSYQSNGQTQYNSRQQTWNSLVITPTNATVQYLQNTMSSSNSNITTLGKCLQSLVEAQQSLLQIIQKWQA